MATDQSPASTGRIAKAALLTVVCLITLQFVFRSYFLSLTEDEVERKVLLQKPVQLEKLVAAETAKLQQGKVTIEAAMKQLATSSRDSLGDVNPKPSVDYQALDGWSELAKKP